MNKFVKCGSRYQWANIDGKIMVRYGGQNGCKKVIKIKKKNVILRKFLEKVL